MKVFVTGATGYIGSAVLDALLASGHKVVGLARSAESEEKLKRQGVEVRRGSLLDPNVIREAAGGSDGVIHTANTNDANAGNADDAAVTNILSALKGTNRPFVYTSGIWVNGDTEGKVIDETAPYKPLELVNWRPEHERRVREAERDKVRGIVIRPGIVYGRGGGIPAMLVDGGKQQGVVTFVGNGENHWPLVHVDDLANLYVLALEKAPPRTLLFGVAGEPVKVKDIAQAASEAAGVSGKVRSWPVDEARKKLGGFADGLAVDQMASGRRAMELLGWRPGQASILDDLRMGSYTRG